MRILIISTGGTIAMCPNNAGVNTTENCQTAANYVRILGHKKDKLGISDISAKTIQSKDSANMVMDDWSAIVNTIVVDYDNYDAFIVTHGTETMGYATAAVAFAIENLGKPVAFTGSQAAFGTIGSDSIMNLENTLRVLTDRPDLVGVFLVFGTQIISGTRVKKMTELAYDAFKTSRRFPPLGVIGSSIVYNESEIQKHLASYTPHAKVAKNLVVSNKFSNKLVVFSEFPGMCADLVTDLIKGGLVNGVILRSYGSGVPNVGTETDTFANLRPALNYMKNNKIPLIITSQAPDAASYMTLYEPSIRAKELGAIPANVMGIEAATVKLAWLLGQNKTYEEIATIIQKPLKGEM